MNPQLERIFVLFWPSGANPVVPMATQLLCAPVVVAILPAKPRAQNWMPRDDPSPGALKFLHIQRFVRINQVLLNIYFWSLFPQRMK
jgi:hypothetical protein